VEGDDLSVAAVGLARAALAGMGETEPRLYEHIEELSPEGEMGKSLDLAEALGALRRGDRPAAVEPTRRLVAAFPSNPEAWALRSYAALHFWFQGPSQERRAELEDSLKTLRRLDPDSPYLVLLRGYVSSADGQPRDAIAAFSDLLERSDLTPGFRAMALGLRADREGDIGDPGAAEHDLREALTLDPTRARTLSRLSRLYRASGRYDEAIEAAQRVIALEPANFESYVILGLTCTKAKKPAEATGAYRKAVKLSRSQYTLSLLSVSLLRERQKSEALEVAREAESLPDSQFGCYNLACARALMGERPKALAMLTRALALGFASGMIIDDEDLASLHGDSRFEAIVREVRQRIGKK
jgi:tetratricopeptide (TPR) repeat protein